MSQGVEDDACRSLLRMVSQQRGQRTSWSNFKKDAISICEQLCNPVVETYAVAQVPSPVLRIGRFFRRDPLARQIRQIRNLRSAQLDTRDFGNELVQYRVHHCRVKCVRG